jgi:epoxyqueuosine reductase
MKKKLLLLVCCGPCSTHVINTLKEDFDVTAFFYNPNIQPRPEYTQRLEAAQKFAKKANVPFIEGKYDPEYWFELIKGHDKDPEGGERCTICFNARMKHTAKFAKENGYHIISNTLTISPHKDAKLINATEKRQAEKAGVEHLEANFKKQDGFKKSIELSKEHELYRQQYCGCLYSLKSSMASPNEKNL